MGDNPWEGIVVGAGTRIQAGIPTRSVNADRKVNGLLLRGVVTATYVSDAKGHPRADFQGDSVKGPTAVYCDVLIYSSLPGQRWFGLRHVLVTQPTGGIHRGRIWKPRAPTINLAKQPIDQTVNPAHLDGDHVLVGFLDDTFDQPIILRGLPHPAVDTGAVDAELGKRMRLEVLDGDPDFFKHHGVYYGVSDLGSFLIDTTWANNGELDEDGHEADPPTDGKGGVNMRLPQDASFDLVLYDMSTPASPNKVMQFIINKDTLGLSVAQGDSLEVADKDADATMALGDGAVAVAVADHLQTLYTSLKAWLEAHTHATGTGPSGIPLNNPAPNWDPNINSNKLTIPDT